MEHQFFSNGLSCLGIQVLIPMIIPILWFVNVDLNTLLLYKITIEIWFKFNNLDHALPIGVSEVKDNSPMLYDLSFDKVTKYFKSD